MNSTDTCIHASLALAAALLFGACSQPPHRPQTSTVLPTHPDEAMRWRRLSWMDEHGTIAPRVLARALEQRQQSLFEHPLQSSRAFPQDSTWIERGPFNVGGRTRSMVIDPADRDHLIAGAVSGGLWRSLDAGLTWAPIDDRLASLAIGCLTRDPHDGQVIYAGTGEGYFNGDALGGSGIYRSEDNGLSWQRLESTAEFDNVARLAVSPSDPNTLLISKRYGGILRSNDRGATWETTFSAQGSFVVEFHPGDGSRAVAHIIDFDFGANDWFHQAIYSTDGGRSWTIATGLDYVGGFPGRIEVAYAPSSPEIVYATVGGGGLVGGGDDGRLWQSTDGGQSYAPVTKSGSTDTTWYASPLWVDPTDPDFVLSGGFNVVKSVDGGLVFEQISAGYIMSEQPHVDIHEFVADPGFDGVDNTRVYVLNDGGIWVADDIYSASRTGGWEKREQHYRTTQFYGGAGDATSNTLVGGTQDNGTLSLIDGSDEARLTFGGDGGFVAIDADDPDFIYGEYILLLLHRSPNGGQTADYIHAGIADAGVDANFIAPFILDPNDPRTLLAGGRSLWRTRDARANAPEWQAIRGPGNDRISAIAVAPGDSDQIWVGLNNGEVWQTYDGTADEPNWTAVDDNLGTNPLPDRYVTRLLIDAFDSERVYVTFGGFSDDNLHRSSDGGTSWQDLTGDGPGSLPDAPIRGIVHHPENPNWLYLGTEVGIFSSDDSGASWSTSDFGPATVSVDEVTFVNRSETLLAATHGRGLFTIELTTETMALSVPPLRRGDAVTLQVMGAAPGARVYLAFSLDGPGREFIDAAGITVRLNAPKIAASAFADSAGTAQLDLVVPPSAPLGPIWLQGAAEGAVSNLVASQIVEAQTMPASYR